MEWPWQWVARRRREQDERFADAFVSYVKSQCVQVGNCWIERELYEDYVRRGVRFRTAPDDPPGGTHGTND